MIKLIDRFQSQYGLILVLNQKSFLIYVIWFQSQYGLILVNICYLYSI